MGSVPKLNVIRTKQLEAAAFAVFAGFVTLVVATRFYGSLRLQTLFAEHWAAPAAFDRWMAEGRGPWSAPLDDVFIHFDFARSAARGHPFQWSEGNGYSSGGTSLLYPFVLAIGYGAGFRDLSLMEWAGVVACVCVFGTLLLSRRLMRPLPLWCTYLLPLGLLCVGTLDWSLFSGMEVALFLALWALSYAAYDQLVADPAASNRDRLKQAALLGLASGLTTATRPEGITTALVLGLAAVLPLDFKKWRLSLAVVVLSLLPSAAVTVAQALANRAFTGETTAAGALVKLELHHPYLDAQAVWDSWLFFLKYQVLRVTHYHFTDQAVYGWIVWLFAAVSLVFPKTRRAATILLCSAALWIAIVAMNGQVRWQNERYTMPAVAWLLLAATLGTAATLDYAARFRRKVRGPLLATATLAAVTLFAVHQAPRFREQVWFFGRAARNILDQHVQAGFLIRTQMEPPVRRVLLGDAGAIPYVSDLPALDVIGLGGYRGLPFARATRHQIGAAVELVERLAPDQRPDLLAIYPGWWGEFPLWFGRPIAAVPVRGNVICGGAAKVLYRPDWSPLTGSAQPFSLRAGERLLDALDQADLVNEREHRYRLTGAPGYVSEKVLVRPGDGSALWDAGRAIPPNATETFRFSGLDTSRPLRLIVRAAPTERTTFEVAFDGRSVGRLTLEPSGGWVEGTLEGLRVSSEQIEVRLGSGDRERIVHHVFIVAMP